MGPKAVRELVEALRSRYLLGRGAEKAQILDQVCEITGYHRKSVIRLFGKAGETPRRRPGRPRVYHEGPLVTNLLLLWEASGYVCGKYLKAAIPELMLKLEKRPGILYDKKLRALLESISASTIDRLLQPHRKKREGQKGIRNRQASTLRNKIAVHTFRELRDLAVGFAEVDLVMHCGKTLKGFHLTTLVGVETVSSWTICYPVWGKGKERVQGAVARLKREAPYTLKGIFTDNGVEFINDFLYQYTQREELAFSHSRPYEKNDQPRVEQRNGSLVRRLVGYGRYTTKAAMRQLEEVYRLACLQANFIKPMAKLISSERQGARVCKHYDEPRTPFRRFMESDDLSDSQKAKLQAMYDILDPLELQQDLQMALDQLWAGESLDPTSERARILEEQIRAQRSE